MIGDMARDAYEPEQPPLTTDDLIDEGRREAREEIAGVIREHIPSLTTEDEEDISALAYEEASDIADWAKRTCACGKKIDGFYQYVDHLIEVFGGESHYGG